MSYKLDLGTVTDVIMNVSICCSLDRGRAEGKESSGGEKRMKETNTSVIKRKELEKL